VNFRSAESLFAETFAEWNRDCAQRLGASVAFYALLSLAPLLVIVVAVVATIFGKRAAQGELAYEVRAWIGGEEATALQTIIVNAARPAVGAVATIISAITLLIGASSVAAELQDAMNTIWHVAGSPQTLFTRMVRLIKERLTSLAMVTGGCVLLLLSVGFSAWLAAIGKFFPFPEIVLASFEAVVSFIVLTVILAAIYKVLPEVPLRWTDVLIGATFTAVLLTLAKQPIAFYLGKLAFGSTYGAAGSIGVVLLWVYYSAQLFFFGAEFTKVYTQRHGSHARAGWTQGNLTPFHHG
jgi:membrane protein